MPTLEALLIEDEEDVRYASEQTLELGGFRVHACASVEEAMAWLRPDFGGIVITDVRLPGRSGLELLAELVVTHPDLPVIVVTGHGDISMAVQAMRAGAYDFVEKPFSAERLVGTAKRAQERRRLVLENQQLRALVAQDPDAPSLIGHSEAIERVRVMIRSVGPTPADILINGETGSGKEVVARQLHLASGRRGKFVAINCGALPESVFESEIFGHEAGAFTSAQKRRIGKLEHAKGGTVFLDEIESMPLSLQVKLLRVLQERRLERLGGNDSIAIDCRIIAASKADLLELSEQGKFRADLYYRIGVITMDLPPLAQRQEDIPVLLSHFVQLAAARYRRSTPIWTDAEMAQWQALPWPGNVRELRNFADRLVLGVIQAQSMQTATESPGQTHEAPLLQQVNAFESDLISSMLKSCDGNIAAAAKRLGLAKTTLYDKIKKLQLS
jgi:two-component system C4-dicarboxylate transport response regulator DctD